MFPMDLNDLIKIVPELLLMVVPGFISLRIKEKYYLEKKHDSFDSTLYCFLYSFIIGIIYSIIVAALSFLTKNNYVALFFNKPIVKQACVLILSVPFGFLLVHTRKTESWHWIEKHFNKSLSPEPSVWIKAMKNPSGAWATVYLKNGMIYTGQLIHYSTNPDDEEKALLLYKYKLSVRNEKDIQSPSEFCLDIVDRSSSEESRVYLNGSDIISVEINK